MKTEKNLWMALSCMGVCAALAIWGLSGCAMGPRIAVRDQWPQPVSSVPIDIVSKDNRRLLRISADGRIWEWEAGAKPEDVISLLIENSAHLQQALMQIQAAQKAAEEKKAVPAPGASVVEEKKKVEEPVKTPVKK